jgi:hypothetical protein
VAVLEVNSLTQDKILETLAVRAEAVAEVMLLHLHWVLVVVAHLVKVLLVEMVQHKIQLKVAVAVAAVEL